jgi:hypothetical protein
MKIYMPAAALFLLAACNGAPPQNNVEDVSANNMIADEVTEVPDESAPSEPANTGGSHIDTTNLQDVR